MEYERMAQEKLNEFEAKYGDRLKLWMWFIALYLVVSSVICQVSPTLYLWVVPGFWWLSDEGVTPENLAPVSFWLSLLGIGLGLSVWIMSSNRECSKLFCRLAVFEIFFVVFVCALHCCYLDVLVWFTLLLGCNYFGFLEGEMATAKFPFRQDNNEEHPRMTLKYGPDWMLKPAEGETADIVAPIPWVLAGSLLLSLALWWWVGAFHFLPSDWDLVTRVIVFFLCVMIARTIMINVDNALLKVEAGIPYTSTGGVATTGPYAVMRHPLVVVFALVVIPGFAVLIDSLWFLAVPEVIMGLYQLKCIAAEEAFLQKTFPEDWEKYSSQVPRFVNIDIPQFKIKIGF